MTATNIFYYFVGFRYSPPLNLTCGACFYKLVGISLVSTDKIFPQIIMIGIGERSATVKP